jgi:hypothetical protein
MPALSFSELNSTKVLPDVKVTSTEGNPAIYASRQAGGRKQKKQQKQKKSKGKTSKKATKATKTRKSRKAQTKKWFGIF